MPNNIHRNLNKLKHNSGIHASTAFVSKNTIKHQNKLKSFLINIYAFKFFSGCVFLYPVMSIMFIENGVSNIQVSILFAMWAFFVFIFQPFMGNFGDKYSRKKILLLGQFAKMLCFGIFILFPNFTGYLIGFIFWGIQWAIEASVCEAFVYDELLCLKSRNKYTEVSGKMLAFKDLGFLLSTTGSFIAVMMGYNFIIILTIISMFLSIFFIHRINMIQPTSFLKTEKESILKNIKIGAQIIKKIKYCFLIMFILSCVGAIAELDDYIGLLGTEIGVPLTFIGGLFAISNIAETIGGFTAKFFTKLSIKFISIIIFIMGGLFALTAFSDVKTIWLILFFAYFFYAIIKISLTVKIQNAVPSSRRSMVLSLLDMLGELSIMIFYGIVTIGSVLGGYRLGYLFCGVAIMILSVIGILFIKEIKKLKNQPCCTIKN